MNLERILAEMRTLTTGIYYKQFEEALDYLCSLKNVEDYIILCQERIYKESKKIGDYFKIRTIKADYLPDDTLIAIVNFEKIRDEFMNFVG